MYEFTMIPISDLCGDCTIKQGVYCGVGDCDFLGRNCDGGCRTGPCDDYRFCINEVDRLQSRIANFKLTKHIARGFG